MKPELWGKHLWKSIHYIALGYPEYPTEIDVQNYMNFYSDLWKVIPCQKCAINYKKHLEELPIDNFLQNKMSLFEWTVKLHNIVNKSLNKPQVSTLEALNIYTNTTTTTTTTETTPTPWSLYFLIIVVIAILIVVLLRPINKHR
jgi:hypothetical protein